MPAAIDVETANQAHPTTRIVPPAEVEAEQARQRMKTVATWALVGTGAAAVVGGALYACYRAGWLWSSTPKPFARRTLDAVGCAFEGALEKIKGA